MRMEYEHLVRTAFDHCDRYGDPFGLANADVYDHASDGKHRLLFGISAALKKVSHDSDPDKLELTHELDELDKKLWKDQSDANIDATILRARELFKQHNI
ncbi:MAG TPA: hypothetical protein VK658_01080 [Chryseolinea sp.]|nr:hypothetical protein [Chryseolinea sp.]